MSSFLQHRRKPFSVLGLLKGEAKGWYDTTASTLKTDAVADFVLANSEALYKGTTADLNSAYTFSFWIKPDNVTQTAILLAKYLAVAGGRSFQLAMFGTTLTFGISLDGSTLNATVSLSGVLTTGWQMITVGGDGVNIWAQRNGGTRANTAATFVPHPAPQNFFVGRYQNGTTGYDGQMALLSQWDRSLSESDVTDIYNSGVFKPYADLTAAEKVSMLSFWHLNEPSGTRYDAHGSVDLLDANTVGVATGPVEYVATENATITKWENQAGNASPFADLTRGAATLSPILSSGIPDWYNAAHALKSATGSMTQTHTLIGLVNLNATATADTIVDGFGATNRGLLDHSTPGLSYLFAGTVLFGPAIASGRRLYIGELNGASSSLKITGYSDTTGDAGTGSMSGASVGAPNSDVSPFNGTIEYVILLDRALTSQEIAALQAL